MRIDKKDVLVVIPARSGSKGIPGKNVKKLNGKPLILYTIELAKKMFSNEQIVVNTDDLELAALAKKHGASIPFIRPQELAQDHSSSRDVIVHLLNTLKKSDSLPKAIMLLQPTSPLKELQHLQESLDLFLNHNCDMVVSVVESKTNPYFNLFEEDENGYLNKSKPGIILRRQDMPPAYEFNGAIYIFKSDSILKSEMSEFKKTKKYVMSKESSVDIDDELDWKMAEFLLTKNEEIKD
ncbi:MAG: acylneuraminate cytidylyltransferase family protein [Crocinitomicaceae bacterium]